MDKHSLRGEVMKRVRALTAAEKEAASIRIARQVISAPWFQEAHTVMVYWPLPTEPDTRGIIREAMARGKMVLLPRCLQAPRMEAWPWRGEEFLRPGPFGILEPIPGKTNDPPVPEPDLILVPCVAVTESGARLGHGGGYYDWFLRNRAAKKVCLCFRTQIVQAIPTEATDVPMDLVITEQISEQV